MKNGNGNGRNGLDSFDHVVVLMLENRSFDNLLGYLFKDPGFNPEKKPFEGLQNAASYSNPVPSDAVDYDTVKKVDVQPVGPPEMYSQPFPDPGEVYQHVNTQLYDFISPGNKRKEAYSMSWPYNIPTPLPEPSKLMNGFVRDYINTLEGLWESKKHAWFHRRKYKKYKNPAHDEYKTIMQCFTASQVPVLSTLAKEFAVFDHWYCSVPSQTWCNRAFWHAGTSGGKVVNPSNEGGICADIRGFKSWIKDVWSQDTLFDRLRSQNISHAVYANVLVSLTRLVHGLSHDLNIVRRGHDLEHFKTDISAEDESKFPQYSFIEPKFFGEHNDQHPSSVPSGKFANDGKTKAGTVLLGEGLIREVYEAIRTSPYRDNTLLIITYDEHGGCFDHVYPDHAVNPEPDIPGEKGFDFKRLGVRVPMVMVSSFIEKKTIDNTHYDHTSFIKTMCKKWKLAGLKARDKDPNTKTFEGIFKGKKRSWPEIPQTDLNTIGDTGYLEDPLNELQKSMVQAANHLAWKKNRSLRTGWRIAMMNYKLRRSKVTVGEAIEHLDTKIKPLVW